MFKADQIKLSYTSQVKKGEAQEIRTMVLACMKELSKKRYELPPMTRPLLVHISQGRSWADKRGVVIDVSRYRKWIEKQHGTFSAVAGMKNKIDIGEVKGEPGICMLAYVASQVAHHVQYAYCRGHADFKDADIPHGECWQAIYRWLRCSLINNHLHY